MDYICTHTTPLGPVWLASDGSALIGLWLEGQKYFRQTLQQAEERWDLPVFAQTRAWLDAYFAGKKPQSGQVLMADALPPMPRMAPRGSEFRQCVWQILQEIPYGTVTTYGEIARRIACQMGRSSMSAQAVGGAVGHNPISILIPCHRVIGKDGSLTGYAGGIDKKMVLLAREGVDMTHIQ